MPGPTWGDAGGHKNDQDISGLYPHQVQSPSVGETDSNKKKKITQSNTASRTVTRGRYTARLQSAYGGFLLLLNALSEAPLSPSQPASHTRPEDPCHG